MKKTRDNKKSRSKEAKPTRLASFISRASNKFKSTHQQIKKEAKKLSKSLKSLPRETWLMAFLAIIILFFIILLLSNFNILNTSDTSPDQQIEEITSIDEQYTFRHPLTGLPIQEEINELQVASVIIENSSSAWPLSGLDQAFFIIEAPVEGLIPRLLAFIDTDEDIIRIGPVRSARPYFIDFAKWFNSVLVHIGGSPESLNRLRAGELRNLNEMTNGAYFYRQNIGRFAPHNVFTTSELLEAGFMRRSYEPEPISSIFTFDEHFYADNQRDQVQIKLTASSPYNVTWEFNEENQNYTRFQGPRRLHILENNQELKADNVIVIKTESAVLDELGRLRLRTSGQGIAWLFRNGYKYQGKWQMEDDNFQLLDIFNEVLPLKPGNTYMHIITDEKHINY